MKKLLTLFLLAQIVAGNIFAQDLLINNNLQHAMIADTIAVKGINGTYGEYLWFKSLNEWRLNKKTYEEFDANSNLTLIRYFDDKDMPISEEQYTYDSKNRVTSYLTKYKPTGQTELKNGTVAYYQYNDNDDLTFTLNRIWDISKNDWRDSLRRTETYDALYRINKVLSEKFMNGTWVFVSSFDYIRTFQNDLLITELWTRSSADFINGGPVKIDTPIKITNTYNSNNLVSSRTYESKQNSSQSEFDLADKYELFYDSNNHLNRVINSIMRNNTWYNIYERDSIVWLGTPGNYFSSTTDDFAVYVYRIWNNNTAQFENRDKIINKNIYPPLSTEKIEMKMINGHWDTTFIHTNLIDEQKNLVLKTTHTITDAGVKKLYVGERHLYTYAGQNKIQEHIRQFYSSAKDSNYVNTYRKVLLVASGMSSSSTLNDRVKIYPNPSNTHFQIDFKTPLKENTPLRIYNLSSQLIQEHLVDKNTTSFKIENLEPGMYIVRIEGESFKVVKH